MNESASAAPKQQAVEQIKKAKHILLTVPKNPTVDELSAAVGLSLLLDKLEKRPTIAFSGKIPPAISFLEPDKLITQDIDGLRDFIIALDKEKADKLRWKVEDDIVKIYITPYKTSLGESDLKFEQGEFNIELIIALGVESSDTLDRAITAHDRILHDAPVVTVNAGNKKSDVGSINWQDSAASSISGMIVAISEALGSNLLDKQMATAFLTGLVANTNRFSNELTTPRVMTMSAKLMSLGANQQLIASHLGSPQVLDENDEANIKKAFQIPKDKSKKSKQSDDLSEEDMSQDKDKVVDEPSKDDQATNTEAGDNPRAETTPDLAEEEPETKQQSETIKPDNGAIESKDEAPLQAAVLDSQPAPQNETSQSQLPPAMPPSPASMSSASDVMAATSQQSIPSPNLEAVPAEPLQSIASQSESVSSPPPAAKSASMPSLGSSEPQNLPTNPPAGQSNLAPSGGESALPSVESRSDIPDIVSPSEGVDDARKAVEDAVAGAYNEPALEPTSADTTPTPVNVQEQPIVQTSDLGYSSSSNNNLPPLNSQPQVAAPSSQMPSNGLVMPPELPPLPDAAGAGFDALPPLPSMPPTPQAPINQPQAPSQDATPTDDLSPQALPSNDDPGTFPLPPYA